MPQVSAGSFVLSYSKPSWIARGLLVMAGPTPPDWEVTLLIESFGRAGHTHHSRFPAVTAAGFVAVPGGEPI